MYRIEPLPPLAPTPRKFRGLPAKYGAVDRERDLVVRHISSYRDSWSYGWLFQAGAALVPFDFTTRLVSEGSGARTLITLDSFGGSNVVGGKTGIPSYDFASDEQRREWTLLAVEGLLVAETYQERRLKLESPVLMEALGRSWTIEDFGYNEGEIINVDL